MKVKGRVRTRSVQSLIQNVVVKTGQIYQPLSPTVIVEEMIDSVGYPEEFNRCSHYRCMHPWTGRQIYHTPARTTLVECFDYADIGLARSAFSRIRYLLFDGLSLDLSFQKDDDFELLNLLGEMDELLLLFSKSFWQNLSYGSINWGLLPFVSDLKSLHASLRSLLNGKIFKEITEVRRMKKFKRFKPFRFDGVVSGNNVEFSAIGVLRTYGLYGIKHSLETTLLALQITLDELGVHPDLRTVWDLLPLSFVLDYFLPIGDLLESIHPRGWFNPDIQFTGGYSISSEIRLMYPKASSAVRINYLPSVWSVYERDQKSFTFRARKPPELEWKCPSFRQLVNTGYVSLSRVRKPPIKVGFLTL